jgi:4-amino-4-deoxy-L-arabinose transferase-like glycosyltransferase
MPPTRDRRHLLAILALWVLFYASFTLFFPPLLDDADSVHAEVAREMLLRHDYITLYANGIRYLEKAPLLYWSMALCFKLFGVSTAAARIPLALTVLALTLTVEAFARRAFRSARAGLYAALILLSSPGIFLFSRITLPDVMVCLWLTVALYAFWLTEDGHQGRVPQVSTLRPGIDAARLPASTLLPSLTFAAACALNVLTKGLIGLVFPISIVVVYLLLTRGIVGTLRRVRQLHPVAATAVFFAIATPWHILIALANPTQGHPAAIAYLNGHWKVPLPTDGTVHGWLWFYFINEQVLRYLNLRVPRDYDTVPLYLFWGLCFVWLMPWSAFVFKALRPLQVQLRNNLRSRKVYASAVTYWSNDVEQRGRLLLLVWAAVVLLFFSLSTRQEYYVLPALPAVAILIADWLALPSEQYLEDELARREVEANVRIATILLALGALFAASALFFLLRTRNQSPNVDLAQLLQQNPSDYAMSMGHFMDLTGPALALFRLPLALAAAGLFFGPLASYLLRKRARPHAATLALAAEAFTFLLAAHLGLQIFAPVLSSQQLAAAIAPQLQPDDLIVIHQEYEFGSTLGFYLRRADIHILEGRSSNLWYGSFFADAPRIFETPQTLAARWPGPQRIFLWQDLANQPSALPGLPGSVFVIARSGGKEIVSNQPNRSF